MSDPADWRHKPQPLLSLIGSLPRLREKYPFPDTAASEVSTVGAQSLRTVDQLSTARASVAFLDKLWTQIDVLDDVKEMAEEVKKRGSFFNENFTSLLHNMKLAQKKLQEAVVRHQEVNERVRLERNEEAQEIDRVWGLAEGDTEKETEITKQKMQKFFFLEESGHTTTLLKDFDQLNDYVKEVSENLGVLGLRMKKFDEATKTLW